MHGAGNDYIYVDAQKYDVSDPSAAAIAWSNRHTGIGSDGLVLIGKPYGGVDADFSMRIFNADGSEAKMCGNASRCIGKYPAPSAHECGSVAVVSPWRAAQVLVQQLWQRRLRAEPCVVASSPWMVAPYISNGMKPTDMSI